ncbi:MAG: LysR family transcriptional regulator [Rubrivivax sp.]|nr:LysR family transcriptional regulator [Rubrivivax sp.]
MDLRQLKYFLVVAEELNIGRAAARLHISQPPLTRQIKAIEDELGTVLFVRTAKGVELTQAGEMFKVEANNIRMLIEGAIDRVQRVGEGKLGRLDVAIFGSAIYEIIPKLLQSFQQKYPGVRIVLHTMSKGEQIEALRQRRITVAFNRMIHDEPDIGRELVTIEPLYAVVPTDHPLAGTAAISLHRLVESPLVLFPNVGRPNFIDHVTALCKAQGLEAEISQEVGDAVTGIALVARGFGVTLIPESAARALTVEGARFLPLQDAPHAVVDLSCLYRATDQSPLLKAFLQVVKDYRSSAPKGAQSLSPTV